MVFWVCSHQSNCLIKIPVSLLSWKWNHLKMSISVPKGSIIKAFMPYCLFQKKDSSIYFGFQVANMALWCVGLGSLSFLLVKIYISSCFKCQSKFSGADYCSHNFSCRLLGGWNIPYQLSPTPASKDFIQWDGKPVGKEGIGILRLVFSTN